MSPIKTTLTKYADYNKYLQICRMSQSGTTPTKHPLQHSKEIRPLTQSCKSRQSHLMIMTKTFIYIYIYVFCFVNSEKFCRLQQLFHTIIKKYAHLDCDLHMDSTGSQITSTQMSKTICNSNSSFTNKTC